MGKIVNDEAKIIRAEVEADWMPKEAITLLPGDTFRMTLHLFPHKEKDPTLSGLLNHWWKKLGL